MTLTEIYANLAEDGDCWVWMANKRPGGYGYVWFNGRMIAPYWVIYEDLRAAIPDGLEIDHLCRNPACCNPWHLEPVTHRVNQLRNRSSYLVRTECNHGHKVTADSVLQRSDGSRRCRICESNRRKSRRQKQRSR